MSEMLLREALANVTSGGWTDDERIEKVVGYQQTNMTASAFFSERVLVGGRGDWLSTNVRNERAACGSKGFFASAIGSPAPLGGG